ncbi:MAG: hypothetical protein MJ051_03870 [Akkermansia sp.]|nr:hypothetical protein [Akkermansia sp.]
MKHFLPLSLLASLCLMPFAGAVELTDLSPTLTRTDADANLTKDYAYRVLSDLTVRRVWNLDDNRKLTIDFDPKKDKLICIVVDYKKPVSSKEGTKAVLDITKAPEAKWNKLSTDKAAKYGVERAKALKVDGGYAFMESNTAGKCIRVSLYPQVPKGSRRHLQDVSTADYGPTAMGNNSQASAGKELMQDEAKRLQTPNKTDLAKNVAESDTMEDDEPVAVTEPTPEPETVKETTSEPKAVVKEDKPSKKKVNTQPQGDRGNDLDALLAKLGLDGLTPMQWGIGGAALILLFTIIGMIRRSAEQKRLKARAEAMARTDVGASLRASVSRPKLRTKR